MSLMEEAINILSRKVIFSFLFQYFCFCLYWSHQEEQRCQKLEVWVWWVYHRGTVFGDIAVCSTWGYSFGRRNILGKHCESHDFALWNAPKVFIMMRWKGCFPWRTSPLAHVTNVSIHSVGNLLALSIFLSISFFLSWLFNDFFLIVVIIIIIIAVFYFPWKSRGKRCCYTWC